MEISNLVECRLGWQFFTFLSSILTKGLFLQFSIKRFLLGLVIAVFLVVVGAEFNAIEVVNNGKFVYTLDDPYIHLALADGIRSLHYGINAGEVAAPSSSILWPYLLAILPPFDLTPLILNVIFSILTIFTFERVLWFSLRDYKDKLGWKAAVLVFCLLLVLTLFTNLVLLAFTGMEHSLQLLLVSVVAYGLIRMSVEGEPRWWLMLAIVMAPLIRYEDMAISCAAILYCLMLGNYRKALIAVVTIALLLVGFSLYLMHMDLGFLPSSILAKSSLGQSEGSHMIFANLKLNVLSDTGVFLLQCLFVLVGGLLVLGPARRNSQLVIVTMFAIFLHLLCGSQGWYHRYEAYVITFSLLMLFHFLISSEGIVYGSLAQPGRIFGLCMMLCGFFAYYCGGAVLDMFEVPAASNNIYSQQYQMRRFVQDFYQKPVAVNDLGLVSHGNANYVLDLWGLGSLTALRSRQGAKDPAWMNALARQKGVGLIMIYTNWFTGGLPKEWIKIGQLRSDKPAITTSFQKVDFYATDKQAYEGAISALAKFRKTLPAGAEFVFNTPEGH